MGWNKPVTNHEPAVRTDTGPYGSDRAKDESGRYTANPNFQGSEKQKEEELSKLVNNSNHPFLSEKAKARSTIGFDTNDLGFDGKVSTPFLKSIIGQTTFGKMVDKPTVTTTTSYEDQNLKIDMYLGEAAPEFAFMYSDPGVYKLDLKTIKGGLGDKSFYDYPLIDFTPYKILARKSHEVRNQINKAFSDNYLFQILSSDSKIVQGPQDINAAKMYMVSKESMKRILDNHNPNFVKACTQHLLYNPSTEDVTKNLSALAKKYDFEYELNDKKFKTIDHIIQTDTETIHFEQDRKTQNWSVRIEFDAMDFDDDDTIIYDEWKRS